MPSCWKPIEVALPSSLSPQQVIDNVSEQVRLNASEAGDFVLRIRIDGGRFHADGSRRWTVSYLPGPPGVFPTPEATNTP